MRAVMRAVQASHVSSAPASDPAETERAADGRPPPQLLHEAISAFPFPSRRINHMTSIHQHATTQMRGGVSDRLSGRLLRRAVIGYFARYRFALYFLLGAGIAAGVALYWNLVTATQLLPILAFLPCMMMMFMCMKHGSRGSDPEAAPLVEASPSQPPTLPDPQQ
jgi:hypothetical protein